MVNCLLTSCSRASSIPSNSISARKPRCPKLIPNTGTSILTISRAIRRNEPSPPNDTAASNRDALPVNFSSFQISARSPGKITVMPNFRHRSRTILKWVRTFSIFMLGKIPSRKPVSVSLLVSILPPLASGTNSIETLNFHTLAISLTRYGTVQPTYQCRCPHHSALPPHPLSDTADTQYFLPVLLPVKSPIRRPRNLLPWQSQ